MTTLATKPTATENNVQENIRSADSIFRFTELPPELRNRVYFHLIDTTDSKEHNLAELTEPAICAVSQQLRNEFLPVFFAEANFYLVVASDFEARFLTRTGTSRFRDSNAQILSRGKRLAGTIGVKRAVQKFIKTAKEAVVFRHVMLQICDARHLIALRNNEMSYGATLVLDIRLDATISLQANEGDQGFFHPATRIFQARLNDDFDVEEVDAMVSAVKSATDSISVQSRSRGFTIQDLAKIVNSLRLNSR